MTSASTWDPVTDVPLAERFGWEWGGHWTGFVDKPHFQKSFNRSIDQLVAMPPPPDGGYIALA
jgi:hypothetical protein